MNRLYAFIITLTFIFNTMYFSNGYVGVSSSCINGNCFFKASTSLISIFLGLAFGLFIFFCPRQKIGSAIKLPIGVWRRFRAFIIDLAAILITTAPILALPAIYFEYSETGTLAWSFHRSFPRSSDNIIILTSIVIGFFLDIAYFHFHQMSQKATLGQYISGYKIVACNGTISKEQSLKRIIYSFIGLFIWPISVIHALFNGKAFWWDRASNTTVQSLSS